MSPGQHARPNPSLEPARYGRQRRAGLRQWYVQPYAACLRGLSSNVRPRKPRMRRLSQSWRVFGGRLTYCSAAISAKIPVTVSAGADMNSRRSVRGESIKRLREAKSWSQQHLADASGLSLRTVQRMEADGAASAESRLAVAAALGVTVHDLLAPGEKDSVETLGSTRGTWVLAASGLGSVFVVSLGALLPPTVASHFGVTGAPDAYMNRESFVALMCLLVAALPALVWWALGLSVRLGKATLPNATYWLAPERRERTEHMVLRHAALLAVGLSVVLCYFFAAAVAANLAEGGQAKLSLALVLPGLAAFLAGIALWQYFLGRQFRRDEA